MNRLFGIKTIALMLTFVMVFGMMVPQTNLTYAEDGVKFHYRDEFNEFNNSFWTVMDKDGLALDAMNVSDGIITLTAKKTDNYPTLISKGIPIEMGDKLIIKRRTYAHPEHDKFAPSAYVTEEIDNSWNMDPSRDKNYLFYYQHLYFTYDKGRYPESITKANFGFARLDSFTKVGEVAKENYGITTSTLDEWVDEEFIYDTVTGDVTITGGGETMNFKSRPLKHSYVRFQMVPYGWYTGQYDQMDWIDIKVVNSDVQMVSPDATASTNGILKGLVLDFKGELAVPNVSVNLLKDAQVVQSVETNASGEYEFSANSGGYDLTLSKSGFIGASYSDVVSTAGQTTYLETILQVPQSSKKASVTGEILNAVTGKIEPEVVLEVRRGINNNSGDAETVIRANSSGSYVFTGEAGYYTFQTKKEGFVDKMFSAALKGGMDEVLSDVAISPVLLEDQIRIVLRWNSSPDDLDSHLIGPKSDGGVVHVYYDDPEYNSSNTSIILDVDDRNGEGPETITVTKILEGVYSYSVHDYSNENKVDSNMLSSSMAAVEVYIGSQPVRVFNVPNQTGTLWKVFTYDGITIKPINNMSYQDGDSISE